MGRAQGHRTAAAAVATRRSSRDEQLLIIEAEWTLAADSRPVTGSATLMNPTRVPLHNEDRAVCDPEFGVAAVFDGMGGTNGGELASVAAAGAFTRELADLPEGDARGEWMMRALGQSSLAIRLSRQLHPEANRQGATAAAAAITDEKVFFSTVGDSRVYHFGTDDMRQLSQDRKTRLSPEKEAAFELADTALTFDEIEHDDHAMGLFLEHKRAIIDAELSETPRLSVLSHPVSPGDVVLVCSDGVHDNLARGEIRTIVQSHRDHGADAVSQALVQAAQVRAEDRRHLRAKRDDITAAVLVVPAR